MKRLIDAERLKVGIFNACIDEHFMPTRLLNWDNITNIIDNAPTVDITEEQAIDKLHETGWLIRHDKEMTERPYFVSSPVEVVRMGEPISNSEEITKALEKGELYKRGFDDRYKSGKEEPMDHWTCIEDNNYAGGGYWECPSCKDRFSFQGFNLLNDMPYCPRCGNRVKTESEVENGATNRINL